MNISKKVFCLALGAMLSAGISPAQAQRNNKATPPVNDEQESEILFKIHNIVPVENSEGEVIACDFDTTFYNRSSYNLREASLEFNWSDPSIQKVIEDEKEEDARRQDRRGSRRNYSETERRTSDGVSVMIEAPALKSYRQATVNNRINTDRCFLLLEKVNFSVSNCSADGMQSAGRGNRSRGESSVCSKLFKYVSPEDAQYYLEFKEITPDEEASQEEAKRKARKKEAADIYTRAVNALDAAGNIVSGIK